MKTTQEHRMRVAMDALRDQIERRFERLRLECVKTESVSITPGVLSVAVPVLRGAALTNALKDAESVFASAWLDALGQLGVRDEAKPVTKHTQFDKPPNIDLLLKDGGRWQHTGNGFVYVVTGLVWNGDADCWMVGHVRESDGDLPRPAVPPQFPHRTVYARTVENFIGDRSNGVPRFIAAKPLPYAPGVTTKDGERSTDHIGGAMTGRWPAVGQDHSRVMQRAVPVDHSVPARKNAATLAHDAMNPPLPQMTREAYPDDAEPVPQHGIPQKD